MNNDCFAYNLTFLVDAIGNNPGTTTTRTLGPHLMLISVSVGVLPFNLTLIVAIGAISSSGIVVYLLADKLTSECVYCYGGNWIVFRRYTGNIGEMFVG